MKTKHINSYLKQCFAIAELSPCSRRKYGALAVDPKHNVVITAGYNGTPRGAYHDADDALCGGAFCLREGLKPEQLWCSDQRLGGKNVWVKDRPGYDAVHRVAYDHKNDASVFDEVAIAEAIAKHPPVESGTRYEVGCHHAEGNVVANAARLGRSLDGSWVFCTGIPCEGCARLLHHAGVAKVVTIRGGFSGPSGRGYLERAGIEVMEVSPPFDMRHAVECLVVELEAEGNEHDADTVDAIHDAMVQWLEASGPGAGPAVDPRRKG